MTIGSYQVRFRVHFCEIHLLHFYRHSTDSATMHSAVHLANPKVPNIGKAKGAISIVSKSLAVSNPNSALGVGIGLGVPGAGIGSAAEEVARARGLPVSCGLRGISL
jgi:hypothetical protein